MKVITPMTQLNQHIWPFLRHSKDFANLLFGYFGHDWTCPQKLTVSTCRKVWLLSSCKKSNFAFISFLKYSWDIASLLFWVLWTCLGNFTKTNSINLLETLMFMCKPDPAKLKLEESCNPIGLRAFWPINWEPEFCQTRDLRWNINNYIIFHFRWFPGKGYDKAFAHFAHFWRN